MLNGEVYAVIAAIYTICGLTETLSGILAVLEIANLTLWAILYQKLVFVRNSTIHRMDRTGYTSIANNKQDKRPIKSTWTYASRHHGECA